MLLAFDIAADTIAEHDDWHTHEHLPERLAIPGFLRGTRLRDDALPRVAAMRGLGSARLLEQAAAAPMTNEQRIRGADAGIDWALFVTGYSDAALAALLRDDLASDRFEAHGVGAVSSGLYRLHYTLADRDVGA